MGLKDLARSLREKSCPAGTTLSGVPAGQHMRTPADAISGTAGTLVPCGTRETGGTTGTDGTDGTNGTTGTGGTRQPIFETLPPSPEPDAYLLAEREALAADRCPPEYLEAWARFQLVRPRWALEGEWREAVGGVGRFLDQWGAEAMVEGWTAEDIFGRERLAFTLRGESVRVLGNSFVELSDGRRMEKLP